MNEPTCIEAEKPIEEWCDGCRSLLRAVFDPQYSNDKVKEVRLEHPCAVHWWKSTDIGAAVYLLGERARDSLPDFGETERSAGEQTSRRGAMLQHIAGDLRAVVKLAYLRAVQLEEGEFPVDADAAWAPALRHLSSEPLFREGE